MDQLFDKIIVPLVTLLIAVGSALLVQWESRRAQTSEREIIDRAASKNVVEALSALNEALGRQVEEIKERMERIEQQFAECLKERNLLTAERDSLLAELRERN